MVHLGGSEHQQTSKKSAARAAKKAAEKEAARKRKERMVKQRILSLSLPRQKYIVYITQQHCG